MVLFLQKDISKMDASKVAGMGQVCSWSITQKSCDNLFYQGPCARSPYTGVTHFSTSHRIQQFSNGKTPAVSLPPILKYVMSSSSNTARW